ncbi:hypothetical protein PF005_g8642 [Phytophthora fragariae]|uniref:Secreted protein n=1 Tax=Phytophthora fragariae TaxID=53985 RepID=A0A6A3YEW0_9STRA|nr:hypothetical protein PF003_g4870 [Phytophthora fragariae]KAE8940552.1 hypothetical protein PF009_g9632 [Phytophthora fragariae]KAE9015567.1 hypothetical protein PF011_g7556 [Phytophthora fragariae]KAE9118403.1 hypothetical protein PF007_g8940 [Phytophthora fragariae]KAE9120064.1 hypothetical protein PF010_g7631 [Phytophthora fragariae]
MLFVLVGTHVIPIWGGAFASCSQSGWLTSISVQGKGHAAIHSSGVSICFKYSETLSDVSSARSSAG